MLSHVDCPDPAGFAYYSEVFLQNEGGAPAIWHISLTLYVIISLLSFLGSARDCMVGIAFVDSRLGGHGRCLPVLRPSGAHCEVDNIGPLENILGSGFDHVTSLVTYSRSCKLDWARFGPSQRSNP